MFVTFVQPVSDQIWSPILMSFNFRIPKGVRIGANLGRQGLVAVIFVVGLMGFIGNDLLTAVAANAEEKGAKKEEKAVVIHLTSFLKLVKILTY